MRALGLFGATALSTAAFAADRPADDAGARMVADFLAAYAGKAALPSVKVSQEGSTYHVSFDLGAATAAMKSTGVEYEPTVLQFKVFQQDDGQWRIEAETPPPIVAHVTPKTGQPNAVKLDVRAETTNFTSVTLLDPKLNWVASVKGGADKVRVVQNGPGVAEVLEFSGLKIDGKTTSESSGLVTTVHEPLEAMNFQMDVDSKGVDPVTHGPRKPVHVSGDGSGGQIDITLGQFQPQPLLDAWRFLVGHPERADVARDFDKLKPMLTALVADRLKLDELVTLAKLNVMTEVGPVGLEGVSVGVGGANMGAATGFYERISVHDIKLPSDLAPPIYAPYIPSSFQFGVKATGFDVDAAVQEWLADAKPDGDAPLLSKEDQDKVGQKLVGGRPILVEIEPSRLVGPNADLAFEGKMVIDNGDRTGTLKITLRDFAKLEASLQTLPPQLAQQATPALAMAKGLATAQPDGSLVWVCSVGHDHMIKVNGLPISKAPF